MKISSNNDTKLNREQLGTIYPSYKSTYFFNDEFINENHQYYENCERDLSNTIIKTQIDGWLRPADALKIYELAYFSQGNILELGTFHGLSTSIISKANHDSNNHHNIATIELDQTSSDIAKANLQSMDGSDKIEYLVGDATDLLDNLITEGKQFSFSFIDHSHKYNDVHQACLRLDELIKPGGFCLFHDYNDPRNNVPDEDDYGIYQAVHDGLSENNFEFYGIFGCSVAFKKI